MKAWLILALLCGAAGAAAAPPLAEWHDRAVIAGTELIPATGQPVHIGDFRGKVVVIDFWGVWCTSCLEEMKSLKQLQQRLVDRRDRVAFLFVSADDKSFSSDNAWFEKSGLDGANYRWAKRTSAAYHAFFRTSNSRWWAPDALILDPQGNIARWIMGGGTDWTKQSDFVRGLIRAGS
jgi:thiol-disulfide isomerase/thioredoxin